MILARTQILASTDIANLLGKDLPKLPDANAIIALAAQLYLNSSSKFVDKVASHLLLKKDDALP